MASTISLGSVMGRLLALRETGGDLVGPLPQSPTQDVEEDEAGLVLVLSEPAVHVPWSDRGAHEPQPVFADVGADGQEGPVQAVTFEGTSQADFEGGLHVGQATTRAKWIGGNVTSLSST